MGNVIGVVRQSVLIVCLVFGVDMVWQYYFVKIWGGVCFEQFVYVWVVVVCFSWQFVRCCQVWYFVLEIFEFLVQGFGGVDVGFVFVDCCCIDGVGFWIDYFVNCDQYVWIVKGDFGRY